MKIAVVHNRYLQPGGEDRVFEQERALLEQAGHRTISFERSNHEIEGAGKLALIGKTIWASGSKREFADLLRREKPDLVHVHNTFFVVSPSIYSGCREAGVPVVQTLHNYRLLCPAAEFARNGEICEECVEHTVWRGVRYGCYHGSRPATAAMAVTLTVHRALGTWREGIVRYIATSQFARAKFLAGGLPAGRIAVKPNFVSPDPGPGTDDRSFALFVGRLARVKGLQTLLAAWAQLGGRIPLHIVGDGPERPQLEAEARRRNLSNVIFRGRLPNAETIAAMQSARFLVFPSEWYENFPVTIAEAFACGTPVLCSRLGSMQEIVADGWTGWHFNVGDPADLGQKAEYAWNHPEESRRMGEQARKEFEAKYTAATNYLQLMNIYESAIASYA
jgi:glycosyltransferase involved in cell wall biosynthesis